jgi:peptidoglycan-associated lipoprotein
MRFTVPLTAGVAVILVAYACGGGPPPPPPGPDLDSLNEAQRVRDSIEAARRAREDSLERARLDRERLEAARRDSLDAVRRASERVRQQLEVMVHYDYDRSNVRPQDAAILDAKLAILQVNPGLRIMISGHCDDRGSDEYNLALGNRRALSAKQYLVDRGIEDSRISTNSFGEERPLDSAANETAWATNRRSEFSITAGGAELRAPGGM